MIINIDQRYDKMVISYINQNGTISFLTVSTPASQKYSWEYTSEQHADSTYRSYDDKPVRRTPSKRLNRQRLQEVFHDLGTEYTKTLFADTDPITSFIDIEVDVKADGDFPDAERALNRINTISISQYPNVWVLGNKELSVKEQNDIQLRMDEHLKPLRRKYNFIYVYHANEADLIVDFLDNYVKPAPVISGWNVWGYDWKYITNRAKLYGIDVARCSPTNQKFTHQYTSIFTKTKTSSEMLKLELPKHKLIYDYVMLYKKWDLSIQYKENFKLDTVGEVVTGIKKVQHSEGFEELYNKKYPTYVFYNGVDSILVEEIHRKLKTFNIFKTLSNIAQVEPIGMFSTINSFESILAQYAYKENKVFPVKQSNGMREEYEGAFVYDPIPGIHELVGSFDFASLYPTIMRQFNMSIENYVTHNIDYIPGPDEIKCASGAVFKKRADAIVPTILTDLYTKRKKAKTISKTAFQNMSDLENILKTRTKI